MAARLDPTACRRQFPALSRRIDGQPAVYFDGPAGSQVPRSVIDAVSSYLAESNANSGGMFVTSRETEAILDEAGRAVADLLGSGDPELAVFGPNMTTLTIALARSLASTWRPDDEVLLTAMEHDANFTPWAQVAREAGAVVRCAGICADDCTLDVDDLKSKLNERTRLVAVGAASNVVGSIHPVREICEAAHAVGAHVFVDAVHYAPHGLIEVERWGCDFLACSAYKFFGPHVGILWGRRDLLTDLPVYRLRPAPSGLPGRWMPGTPNHEGIAGTRAAIDYLAGIGRAAAGVDADRRTALKAAFEAIVHHENGLEAHFLEVIGRLESIRIWGIIDPSRLDRRVPTFALTHAKRTPREIVEFLAGRGIFAWHGNFYGIPVTEALGLEPDGVVRVGLMHYNTTDEIDRLGRCLAELG